jgi:segregation and condensation protein B
MTGNPSPDDAHHDERRGFTLRRLEAIVFASVEPVSDADLALQVPHDLHLNDLMTQLQRDYQSRGVQLVHTAQGWQFRTAPDLTDLIAIVKEEPRKLSKVALETLAIIAYHQPVTRAEIEDIRGVSTMRGTLDTLLETGWVRLRGRRKTPGRPVTYGTTPAFLAHFGLEALSDLPGLEELKGAGFIEGRVPSHLHVPNPSDDPALNADEDPLEEDEATLFNVSTS